MSAQTSAKRTKPRYEVCSITGYGSSVGPKLSTSYWVADRDYGFREVAKFYGVDQPRIPEAVRRQRAEQACARLNAEHEAWLRSEVSLSS